MKLECNHVDTCLPDYWGGNRLPHVQIPVWTGISMKAIKSAIKEELSQGIVAGSTEYARMLRRCHVTPDKEKLADQVTRAAHAAVNRMKPDKKGARSFFNDIEKCDDDDCGSVYAFFVFDEI